MIALDFKIPTRIALSRFEDNRGYLEALLECNVSGDICVKRTNTKLGVIRGFHWQHIASPQAKIIFVLRGSIFDVSVEMNGDRPLMNSISHEIITEDCEECIYVPPHYAHAYQALTEDSLVLYFCLGRYDAEAELSINPLTLNIDWPVKELVVSEKDLSGVNYEISSSF